MVEGGTGAGDGDGLRIELSGVPETLLWNLYHRAHEARSPRTVLHDPKAVELVDRLTALGHPFEAAFGPPNPLLAQGHALRVRTFDSAVAAFLDRHPDGAPGGSPDAAAPYGPRDGASPGGCFAPKRCGLRC